MLRRMVIEGGSDLDNGARIDLSLSSGAVLDVLMKMRIMSI